MPGCGIKYSIKNAFALTKRPYPVELSLPDLLSPRALLGHSPFTHSVTAVRKAAASEHLRCPQVNFICICVGRLVRPFFLPPSAFPGQHYPPLICWPLWAWPPRGLCVRTPLSVYHFAPSTSGRFFSQHVKCIQAFGIRRVGVSLAMQTYSKMHVHRKIIEFFITPSCN